MSAVFGYYKVYSTKAGFSTALSNAKTQTIWCYSAAEPTIGREEASGMFRELRWPHWHVNQVHGLALRELGGGFSRFHRSPSIRAASYAIMKPSVLVQKIQIIKKFRGHRNVVYCGKLWQF